MSLFNPINIQCHIVELVLHEDLSAMCVVYILVVVQLVYIYPVHFHVYVFMTILYYV